MNSIKLKPVAALATLLALLPNAARAQANGAPCNVAAIYDASTNGSTQLVASKGVIFICGFSFFSAGTVNVKLIYGTGAACVAGSVNVTPAFQFTAQTGFSDSSSLWRGLTVPAGNALCINTSAGIAVQAIVHYGQF